MDIRECIEKGFLSRINPSEDLVEKELNEAEYDFESSESAVEDEDWKWAIVKAYYCMFHAARAVLFRLGYRESRHFAIGIVLEDIQKKGMLESRYVNYFHAAVSSREDADYHYLYTKEIAGHSLKMSKEFLESMKKLLKGERLK